MTVNQLITLLSSMTDEQRELPVIFDAYDLSSRTYWVDGAVECGTGGDYDAHLAVSLTVSPDQFHERGKQTMHTPLTGYDFRPALDVADRAVAERWSENWVSPQEMRAPPRLAGTVEVVFDEFSAWRRIWCADATCRRIPDGIEVPVDAFVREEDWRERVA